MSGRVTFYVGIRTFYVDGADGEHERQRLFFVFVA